VQHSLEGGSEASYPQMSWAGNYRSGYDVLRLLEARWRNRLQLSQLEEEGSS